MGLIPGERWGLGGRQGGLRGSPGRKEEYNKIEKTKLVDDGEKTMLLFMAGGNSEQQRRVSTFGKYS